MPDQVKKTSEDYLHEYISYLRARPALSLKDPGYYVQRYSALKDLIDVIPGALYLLDLQTQKYLYVSNEVESLLGYTVQEIYDKGHAWFLSKLHPDDLATFSDKPFEKFVSYSRSLPLEEIKSSRFSVNYRVCRNDGKYVQFFDQHVVLEADDNGSPLLIMGLCTDISAHKTDTKVVFSISQYDKEAGFKSISTESFPNPSVLLTKREKEVLDLLRQGHSSKQIADQLSISLFTVNAHRRSLLEKTNSQNTAQLMTNAIFKGVN